MKSVILRYWILLFLLGSGAGLSAQPDKVPANYRFDFRLPTPAANKSFRLLINGIADFNASTQFTVYENFTMGLQFKYAYYKANDLKTPDITDGKIFFNTAKLKLGYEKFVTDRFFYDLSLKAGYGIVNIRSKTCEASIEGRGRSIDQGFSWEPSAGLYLISDDNLAFGLIVAYTWLGDDFNALDLCLDNSSNIIHDEDNFGAYQVFSVGFGASVFIGKHRPYKGKR